MSGQQVYDPRQDPEVLAQVAVLLRRGLERRRLRLTTEQPRDGAA